MCSDQHDYNVSECMLYRFVALSVACFDADCSLLMYYAAEQTIAIKKQKKN